MGFSQLERPVQFLKGVGPRRAEALARMGILNARDLLYHVPRRYDDASTVEPIANLEVGMEATAVGRVRTKGVIPTRSGLRIFQAVLEDHTGMITCAWPGRQWLDRKIRQGDVLLVTGPVKFFHGRQIQPREFTLLGRGSQGTELPEEGEMAGVVFVAYPASEDVPQWVLRQIFEKNLDRLLPLAAEEEYLDEEGRRALRLPTLPEALGRLHRPESPADAETGRRRLAFDELFFLQLVQARVRWRQTLARPGIVFGRTNELVRPLHEALPFELTEAQARALREIYADMTSERRMSRLLQGDVGSGKTVVALFSMLLAVESGWQAALMAPTEILAEQHASKLREILRDLPVDVVLLTGRLGAPERREVLGRLASGEAGIVVGTHALIQEGVDFHRLGLVVVDEQHRFGVRQRMALTERGGRGGEEGDEAEGGPVGSDPGATGDADPDVLIMSATPIPRSLAMTLYGDLDLSVLDELPPGRRPIRTTLRYPGKRKDVYAFVGEQVAAGRQAYVVYPLVEESEKIDLRAATEEFERLRDEVFPDRSVGLVHGRLPGDEKDRTMRAFRDGDIDVLVATTVIEVGIDVPNATVMVIEHAERFGLSQLHQLRGRVGRGAAESFCVLVAEPGEAARERLEIFKGTQDGFEIARADLRIRGQGDLFGAQQHGRDVLLRFADLTRDEGALIQAQRLAREIVAADPELERPEHAALSELLDRRYGERLKMFATG
jgi:ATP-dependent DNA helicase RecG